MYCGFDDAHGYTFLYESDILYCDSVQHIVLDVSNTANQNAKMHCGFDEKVVSF